MRIFKTFFFLVFALAIGFLLHYNWTWLSKSESISFFKWQSIAFPMWTYLVGTMLAGAFFVTLGSLWDVLKSRRICNEAIRELDDLKTRYDSLRGAEDQDVAYNVGDSGTEELAKGKSENSETS